MPCRVRRHRDYQSGNIKHQTLDIRYQRHQTSDIRHQSKDRGGQGQGLELELEMEMETGTRAVMKCFFLSSSFPFFSFLLFPCSSSSSPLSTCVPRANASTLGWVSFCRRAARPSYVEVVGNMQVGGRIIPDPSE